jgi:hypothetical protein
MNADRNKRNLRQSASIKSDMSEIPVNHIPISLKPFFQDVEFESLDPERNAPTIMERTLADGNVEEIRWLFARYGKERIMAWVRERGARRLPRDRRALWYLLLELGPVPTRITLWSH